MAAPSFRAAGLGPTSSTTSTTVPKPAGTAAGDTLYAAVVNGGAAVPPPTVPADWALTVGTPTGGGGWAGVYEHKAGASEPSSYTWDGFTDSCAGSMVGVVGADTTSPTHKAAATAVLNSSTPTGAAITTTVGECLIVAAIGIGDNTGVTTWACATDPTTLTERAEVQSTGGADSTSAMATAPQGAPGPTGNLTATLAGSRNSVVFLIAVQPPQDAGGTVDATLDASMPALTAAADVEQQADAQLDATLPALGAAVDANIRTTIVLGATLPTLGAAIEAAGGTGAALAATLPPLTATAHLDQADPGTLDATLPALTASLAADLVEPGGGHLSARLPALTASVEATTRNPAAVSSTLPAMSAAVETSTVTTAALTATLPALTADLTAGEPVISGTLDAALPRLTAAVTSRTVNLAAIAAGLPALAARITQTPDVVPIDVTIGEPRTAWGPGTPGIPPWSIGAPTMRRWP